MPRQNQHYVWKYYLKPWCNNKGFIHFSRNEGEVKLANPDRIMAQKNFYELHPLNDDDKKFLEHCVRDTKAPVLKSHHRKLVDMFSLISDFRELLDDNNPNRISLTVEVQELLHRKIESDAIPILDELRQKRKEFLACDTSAFAFFKYLAHQSLRTKKTQDYLTRPFVRSFRPYDISNTANVFIYMTATNLAHNLALSEDGYDVAFIESKEGQSFVTGDQPVINLLGNRQWGESTDTLFYYPLTPALSCLITTNKYGLRPKPISESLVNRLNGNIAWFSHEIIVGDSESAIELAIKNKPFPNQSVRNILDQLQE